MEKMKNNPGRIRLIREKTKSDKRIKMIMSKMLKLKK